MKIETMQFTVFETNTYILYTDGGSAVVIDPAGEADEIAAAVRKNGARLALILLTHGHLDHTQACGALREAFGAPVLIHGSDSVMLEVEKRALPIMLPGMSFSPMKADKFVEEGDAFVVDEVTIRALHTPGHTAGGMVYIADFPGNEGLAVMFSGDTLFAGTIGGMFDVSASGDDMTASLKRLAALPGDYAVLSGHGEATTLDHERRTNPYLLKIERGNV